MLLAMPIVFLTRRFKDLSPNVLHQARKNTYSATIGSILAASSPSESESLPQCSDMQLHKRFAVASYKVEHSRAVM